MAQVGARVGGAGRAGGGVWEGGWEGGGEVAVPTVAGLSDTMYLLISFRKSTSPQNRQLNILISTSKQLVDDFVGELTF